MKKQFVAVCASICLATISAAHSLTLAQMNAVRSADYLTMSGFLVEVSLTNFLPLMEKVIAFRTLGG